MRLYFPVDLTGNLIMIEKLVLGEIWTGDLPIFNPDALTSAPSWQVFNLTGPAKPSMQLPRATGIAQNSRVNRSESDES